MSKFKEYIETKQKYEDIKKELSNMRTSAKKAIELFGDDLEKMLNHE